MRDRTWEKRLPKILKALTVDELAFLSAQEAVVMGVSELTTEDLAAWYAALPRKGQKRVTEVLRARVEASVWRLEVLENVSDDTERLKKRVLDDTERLREEVLGELRRFLDDLQQ